jgi:hypothetical protein
MEVLIIEAVIESQGPILARVYSNRLLHGVLHHPVDEPQRPRLLSTQVDAFDVLNLRNQLLASSCTTFQRS